MQGLISSLSTPTAKNTFIFYFASFTQNIFRYLFHLILLRMLLPAEYGEFLSYLSLLYLLSIPTTTISTIVTKYVSEYKAKKEKTKINLFFYYLVRTLIPLVSFFGLILFLFANQLSVIFKAHPLAFVILGLSMFISLLQTIATSYITAFQEFIYISIVGFLNIILTISLSILFIKLGLGATGAVLGQIVAGLICTLVALYHLKPSLLPRLKKSNKTRFSLGGFTKFSFIYSLGTLSLISTDVLVVRAFSDSHFSGLYSALSILGRMILFGLTPLIGLTLPLATHRKNAAGSARSVFIKMGALISVLGLIGAGIFSMFSTSIVRLLSGPTYLEIAAYLPIFAFSMVFFALSQFVISYVMAIGNPKINYILFIATILQPVVLYLFRASFSSLVWTSFVIQIALFLSLVLYFLKSKSSSSQ